MSSPHPRQSIQHQGTDAYQTNESAAPAGWEHHRRSVNTIWPPPALEMKPAQLSMSSCSSAIEGEGEHGTTDTNSDSDSDSDTDTFPATTAASTDVDDDAVLKSIERRSSSSSLKGVQKLLQMHGAFKTSVIVPAAPQVNQHDQGKAERPSDRPGDQVDDGKAVRTDSSMDHHPALRVNRAPKIKDGTGSGPLNNVTTSSLTIPSKRQSRAAIEAQHNHTCKSKRTPSMPHPDHTSVHPWSLSSITHTDKGGNSGHSSGDDNSDSSSSSSINAKNSGRKDRPFLRPHHPPHHIPPALRRSSYPHGPAEHPSHSHHTGFPEQRRHSSSSILTVSPSNAFSSGRRSSVPRRSSNYGDGSQASPIAPPTPAIDHSMTSSFSSSMPPSRQLSSSMPSIRGLAFTMTVMKSTTDTTTPVSGFRKSTTSSRSSTPAFVYSYASATSSIRSTPAASRRNSATLTSTLPNTFILQGFLERHSNGHQLYRRPSRKCCPDCSAWLSEVGQDSSATCCYSSTECERDGDDEDEDDEEEEEEDERFLLLAQSPNSSEFDVREFVDREMEKKAKSHQADSPVFFHGFPLLRMTPMER